MKKILMIIRELQDNSGVTSVIKNNYDKLIDYGYKVDFCAMYNIDSKFREYVISKGSNYYIYPQYNGRPDKTKENEFLEKLLKENYYDLIHVHITGKYALLALRKAKENNIPNRIYHAHNPRGIRRIKEFIRWLRYDPRCIRYANNYLACSNDAGKSIFKNKKFNVIRNTIEVNKYLYDAELRKKYKKELKISDNAFILGTVCRITEQKNPLFTLEVFKEIIAVYNNSYLVWVGAGDKEEELKNKIKENHLENRVILLGQRSDANKIYSVFDSFILPSFYEGLGISFIEAQANGLRTYASNKVPNDTEITDLIKYLPLKKTAKCWAGEIIRDFKENSSLDRKKYNKIVEYSGYDTKKSKDLLECYNKIFIKNEKKVVIK